MKPCFQQFSGKEREISASTSVAWLKSWRQFIVWVEFVVSLLSWFGTFPQNTRVFFSYTYTCMVKSSFGVGSVSRSVLYLSDKRLTCNTNVVAFFVGLR